jgi:hypothetical protein
MADPKIEKGVTFQTRENITNTKLHNLVDLAGWTITGQTAGDMVYFDGTDYVRIPKGTNGQVLTMNASLVPTWTTP